MRATIPPEVEQLIWFRTFPHAVCQVLCEGEAPSPDPFTAYGDDDGLVLLHVRAGGPAEAHLVFSATCTAGDRSESVVIELRSADAPTPQMPPPAPVPSERPSPGPGPVEEYPPRPDPSEAPEAFAAWERLVGHPLDNLVARVVERPDLRPGSAGHPIGSSDTWCGFVVQDPGGGLWWVTGTWRVPEALPAHAGFYGECAMWVGLDGWSSRDVVQAGTDSVSWTIVPAGGPTWCVRSYFTWHQWFPGPSSVMGNLPVAPGDKLGACVWVDPGNRTAGYWVANLTRGVAAGSSDQAPTGAAFRGFAGDSAEWILERPSHGSTTQALAPFAIAEMTGAVALRRGDGARACHTGNTPSQRVVMMNSRTGALLAAPVSDGVSSFTYWCPAEG